MPYLTLFRENKIVGTYRIESDRISVGRSPDNTIAFANKSISRYHFRIDVTPDGYVLTDLNSLNGTLVNGKMVERTLLKNGDEIAVDPFRVHFALAPPPADSEVTLHGEKLDVLQSDDNNEQKVTSVAETGIAKVKTSEFDRPEVRSPDTSDVPDEEATGTVCEELSTAEFKRTQIAETTPSKEDLPASDLFHITGKLNAHVRTFDDPPHAAIVSIEGYVDNTNFAELQDTIHRTIDKDNIYLLIELSELKYMSSSAWTVLSEEAHALRSVRGALVVVGMTSDVAGFYRSLQFDRVILSFEKASDALGHIQTIREKAQKRKHFPESITIRKEKTFAELSLAEKIQEVIGLFGPMSTTEMLRHLRSPRFGETRIGLLRLMAVLRSMDLLSKEKQHRYYRSR